MGSLPPNENISFNDLKANSQENLESVLVDTIFNDLMDCRDYDEIRKINKYIFQMLEKFKFSRINSPEVRIDIDKKDLKDDSKKQIEERINDCKTGEESYSKLDGIITEVIALVFKQAEPLILANTEYEDHIWVKKSINEIRPSVSNKWRFV
jgi:hypothetical protein